MGAKKTKSRKQKTESDSTYLLKLVLYMILGSIWIKISTPDEAQIPFPIGFLVGMIFAMHDHFQIDRKVEYAMLLIAMFIGFWLPIGIFITT